MLLRVETHHHASGHPKLVGHDRHGGGVLLVVADQRGAAEHRGKPFGGVPRAGLLVGAVGVVAILAEPGLDRDHALEVRSHALRVFGGAGGEHLGNALQPRQRFTSCGLRPQLSPLLRGRLRRDRRLQQIAVTRNQGTGGESLIRSAVVVSPLRQFDGALTQELQPARDTGLRHPDVGVLGHFDGQVCAGLNILGHGTSGAQVLVGLLGHVEHVPVVAVHHRQPQPRTLRHAGHREQRRVLEVQLHQPVAHQRRRIVPQIKRRGDPVAQHLPVSSGTRRGGGPDSARGGQPQDHCGGHRLTRNMRRVSPAVDQNVGVVTALSRQLMQPHPRNHSQPQRSPKPQRRGRSPHPEGDAEPQEDRWHQQRPEHGPPPQGDGGGDHTGQQPRQPRHDRGTREVARRGGYGQQIPPALDREQHQATQRLQRGDETGDGGAGQSHRATEQQVGESGREHRQRRRQPEPGRDPAHSDTHGDARESRDKPLPASEGRLQRDNSGNKQRPHPERPDHRSPHVRLPSALGSSSTSGRSSTVMSPT